MTVKRYDFYYNDDFGVEFSAFQNENSDGEYVSHDDYSALLAERDALQLLAEERREFIVNGVEYGFIRLPDDGLNDNALKIYDKCITGGSKGASNDQITRRLNHE